MQAANTRTPGAERFRVTLHKSSLAHVEDVSVPPGWPVTAGWESTHVVALAYHGLFAYNKGQQRCLVDANRTLFIVPEEEYSRNNPLPDIGHAAVIINASRSLLDQTCGARPCDKDGAFVHPSRSASMQLRLMLHHLLRLRPDEYEPMRIDEWVIDILQQATGSPVRPNRRASRWLERAKEVLHARVGERVLLDEVASEVGVSPVHLSQQFKRQEGVSLYRYFQDLRVSRALVDLPHCDDIIRLAFDLGFSSHSHFTAMFRAATGITPSDYRAMIGSQQLQIRRRSTERQKAA